MFLSTLSTDRLKTNRAQSSITTVIGYWGGVSAAPKSARVARSLSIGTAFGEPGYQFKNSHLNAVFNTVQSFINYYTF